MKFSLIFILPLIALANFVFADSAHAATLVQDTFTDDDATAVSDHTANSGQSWTVVSGTITVTGNKLQATGIGGGGESVATIAGGQTDGTVSAVFTPASGEPGGLILRYENSTNYYLVSASATADELRIYKRNGGSYSLLNSTAVSLTEGSSYLLSATITGNTITARIANTQVQASDSSFSGTQFGVRFGNTTERLDDFIFTTNNSSGESVIITSPAAYQIYQRSDENVADISLSGSYTGTPTAIEARFNGGDWQTIDSTLSNNTFSGTLTDQESGQGSLEVRFTTSTTTTDSTAFIGIGDVFLVAGQSNANGYGDQNQSYSHPSLKASMFQLSDTEWSELEDPTGSSFGFGSAWTLLASLIMASENVPVGFITTAVNGSGLNSNGDWVQGGTRYNNALTTLNNSGVNSVKAILWHQGENEILAGTTQSAYQTAVSQMLDDMQSDNSKLTDVQLVMAQIGMIDVGAITRDSIDPIRLAQLNRWAEDTDILSGPTLYDIDLSDGDGVHIGSGDSDGNDELQTSANRWWAALEYHFYDGTDGRGPRISAAGYNPEKTELTLSFTDETGPVLPSGSLGGFRVEDDGSPVTISSATKISDNKVRLTLDSAASGTVTVSLGSGNDGAGQTVLTDSSTYNLPAEIFVDYVTTPLDETAPSISSVASTTSSNEATITFTTNEDGSSIVEYGLTSEYGDSSTESNTDPRVTSHQVILTELESCTTYHYRVKSSDAALNEGVSADNTFTTNCGNSGSSQSSNSKSRPKAPVCSKATPIGKPDLFQVNRTGTEAQLFFTPVSNNVQGYHVVFGFTEGDERFGGVSMVAQNQNDGVQSITIANLDPDAQYAFKVIPAHGCATGEWSNWLSTSAVRGRLSIFYRYWDKIGYYY